MNCNSINLNILSKLQALEQESLARGIPIVGSKKGSWLLQKVLETKPKQVLELGTANGYSGCILGSAGAELTTVELNAVIADEARDNFQKQGINAKILVGDAVEIVRRLAKEKQEYYDLIFIDFAKKQYLAVLEDCIKLARKGGLIIADNIAMEGCRDYQEAVLSHPRLKTELIPIRDGLSCSRKNA